MSTSEVCGRAAQLITIIRQDLNLTKSGVSGANVAAITGTIFARVASAFLLRTIARRIRCPACSAPSSHVCVQHSHPCLYTHAKLHCADAPARGASQWAPSAMPSVRGSDTPSCSAARRQPVRGGGSDGRVHFSCLLMTPHVSIAWPQSHVISWNIMSWSVSNCSCFRRRWQVVHMLPRLNPDVHWIACAQCSACPWSRTRRRSSSPAAPSASRWPASCAASSGAPACSAPTSSAPPTPSPAAGATRVRDPNFNPARLSPPRLDQLRAIVRAADAPERVLSEHGSAS